MGTRLWTLRSKYRVGASRTLPISAKPWIVRGGAISLALVVLGCAAGIACGYVLKRAAANLVHDVAGLTVGRSTFLDVDQIALSYRRFRVQSWSAQPTSTETCGPEKCFFNFDLSNFLISRVRLVRPAIFRTTVEIHDNRVTAVDIVFWGGRNGLHGAMVQEAEASSTHQLGPYSFPTPVGKPYFRVFVTPEASAIEKQHAFTISVDCLASWRACDLGCDYLPLAWQDWKRELLTRQVDDHSFLMSYPQSTRCR